MNLLIRWNLFLYVALIVCTSVWADSKGSEITEYLARAQMTESTDEKLYLYKKALVNDPKCIEALIGRGNAYFSKSNTSLNYALIWRSSKWLRERGMEDLNHAVELSKNSAPALNARGMAYESLGRYKDALADINRAIELEPNKCNYFLSRCYVYKAMQQYDQAIADIDRALVIDQKSVEAHLVKADIFQIVNNYPAAKVELDKAVSLDRSIPFIYVYRASYFEKQNKIPEAITEFNQAIEFAPLKPWFYEKRADLLKKLGKKELAEKDETISREINPTSYYQMGVMSAGEQAIQVLNTAIDLNPWDFSYYMYRGRADAQKGDFNKALIDINHAIELGVDVPEPYIFRSMVYGELERYDEAIADLKRACDSPEGKCEEYKIAVKSLTPYKGQVVDKKTRGPIPGAYIVLRRTAEVYDGWSGSSSFKRDYGAQYAISDMHGRFVMPPLSKRPVLPDVMGRKTKTYISGIYRPKYSSYVRASLDDPAEVVIESGSGGSNWNEKLKSYFPDEISRMELRTEDFPKAIEMLKIWKPLVDDKVQEQIQQKIEELEMHINGRPGEYRAFLYDTK